MSNTVPPRHVAVIMDGNGRWAKRRLLPRAEGHRRGLQTLHDVVEGAVRAGIETFTVFAFSSENWRRPEREVRLLMELFASGLKKWSPELARQGVSIRVIGDMTAFSPELRAIIDESCALTAGGTRMRLNIAANYGGRWDLVQAARSLAAEGVEITEEAVASRMSVADVDLLIRTGGEHRLSNFLLWQASYAELYFTPTLWPDFSSGGLEEALAWYHTRERRFGKTSEQLVGAEAA